MIRRVTAAALLVLFLTGCGGPSSSRQEAPSSSQPPAASSLPAEPEPLSEPSSDVDLDLTTLSGTMVFAEVSNLLYDPVSYLGKTVRMEGTFSVDHAYTMEGEPDLSEHYFYCVIQDALACCAQGLEFSLADAPAYPDGYPQEGSRITVAGTVEFFEQNGFRHLRLGNAVLESSE